MCNESGQGAGKGVFIRSEIGGGHMDFSFSNKGIFLKWCI
jgi:hypothetical protein